MERQNGILDIVYEMKQRCNAMDQELMDRLRLSQSELQFFIALDNCVGISSPELAKNMGLSASRVSRVVDKLVVNGFLDRNTDTNDRRAITLCLTETGRQIKQEIDSERKACEHRLLQVLPESEIQSFRGILSKIIKELK